MSKGTPTLGIELRFWPSDRAEEWERTLSALWEWDPALRPQAVHIASGEGSTQEGDQPWTGASHATLGRLCAGQSEFSWFMGNDARRYVQCSGRGGRISIAMQLPELERPADGYLDLLARLAETNRPELGLLFDYGDVDVPFDQEGLRRLRYVPPILHVGPRAVLKLGGPERLRAAPCDVREAAGGGLLLVVRPNPLSRPTSEETARARAVAEFLGISEDHPLALMPAAR